MITYHLVGGGADEAMVAKYAEMAANHANLLSAYPDAGYYYRIAIENLGKSLNDQLRLAYLLECLGECVRIQGKDEEARGFFERALDARTQHFTSIAVEDPQQEAQIQAMLWCQIGRTWYGMGNTAKAREHYGHAEQILIEADVLSGTVWATIRFQQSYVSWREGNYENARLTAQDALTLFEEALKQQKQSLKDIFRLTSTRRTLMGDPVDLGRTHVLLGNIETCLGQYGATLIHMNIALPLFEQYDCLREIAIVCCDLGDVYLRKADYSQAQLMLRRSLNLAERVGEILLISVVFGNLGISDIRTGNLVEAEAELRQAIVLADRVDDPGIASVFYTYLANTLREQGKLSEVSMALQKALAMSRATHIAPYIGPALVALGNMRISQAISVGSSNESQQKVRRSLLERAKKTLKHAQTFDGMEAETRNEGQLALAQAALLSGDLEEARTQVKQALEEARHSELMWLVARAQQLSGCIESEQNRLDLASQHFEQALRIFRKSDMHLEQARTLHFYGMMLIKQDNTGGKRYLQGLGYLQDALKTFIECKAELDREMVEQFLAKHNVTATR